MKSPEAPPAADYQVRLDIFEGPLDLLLYLVRKEEVELYEVSLERLIQQYPRLPRRRSRSRTSTARGISSRWRRT